MMRATSLCVVLSAAMLYGCSPTKSGISDAPVPDNQIYIMAGAGVSTPTATGKAPYMAFCQLQYTDTSRNNIDFNSAEVTVNGIALKRIYDNGFFQSVGTTMEFEEGDSLQFVIKHQKIGTIKGVVYVPPSVDGVTVSPGLSSANLPNSETTFDLRWTHVAANYYLVQAEGYNFWQTILVADSTFGTEADSATVVLKDTSGSACPYVYFRVQAMNYFPITGFAQGSGINVSGTYYIGSSNMPGVTANGKNILPRRYF